MSTSKLTQVQKHFVLLVENSRLLSSTVFFNFGLNRMLFRAIFGHDQDYIVNGSQFFEMELEHHNMMVMPSAIILFGTLLIAGALIVILLNKMFTAVYKVAY